MERKLFAGFALVGLLLACAGAGFFSGGFSHDHSNADNGGSQLFPTEVSTNTLRVGGSTTITQIRVYTATIDPGFVGVLNAQEESFTIAGLTTADKVFINKPSYSTQCAIGNARVSASNTLAITFVATNDGLSCDPPSETYTIVAIRS